jgi:virginiamycin B lyase
MIANRTVISVLALAFAGCSGASPDNHGEDVGRATADIKLTPLNVQCIQFNVNGVIEKFPVTPNTSSVFDLTGLPIGTDTFTVTAFNVPCAQTATATPTFTSNQVVAMVTTGTPPMLAFTMSPVTDAGGGAMASVDFPQSTAHTITEFPAPSGINPGSIVTGPDGALWYTGNGTETGIVRFAIDSSTSTVFPTSGLAFGITVGPDQNLWFSERLANGSGGGVGRVTPAGVVTESLVVPNARVPVSIVTAPDGNFWLSTPATVDRLTIGGAFTEFVSDAPAFIAVGPDGNLWLPAATNDTINRITSGSGTIARFAVPTAGANPVGVTAGSDGNIWFTEELGQKIGRMSPTGTNVTEFTVLGEQPANITLGPDGNLWFTATAVTTNAGAIGRITQAGVVTIIPTPTTNAFPFGITAGPDGAVWFTEANAIGRVTP